MRKSRYVTILLAATALVACDQKVMTDSAGQPEETIYGDSQACAKDNDAAACQQSFETAKAEHIETAPKFESAAACETAGYNKCEEVKTVSSDGVSHSSGLFMPMMMGYLMGRTLGGGPSMMNPGMAPGMNPGQAPERERNTQTAPVGAAGAGAVGRPARPVYADRNGNLYADKGTLVGRTTPGATSLGSQGIARTVSRGGFGNTANGSGGGS